MHRYVKNLKIHKINFYKIMTQQISEMNQVKDVAGSNQLIKQCKK